MMEPADLDAAVQANIISEEQRDALAAFLLDREAQSARGESGPQPIPASFREAFLAVAPALLILAAGTLSAGLSRR